VRLREFIVSLIGTAMAWPLVARAQQSPSKLYRIGMLETVSPALNAANLNAFRKGLMELGYVEEKNYVLDYRSADGVVERLPHFAAELVSLKVDVIVTRERRPRWRPKLLPPQFQL
jgi:putative ABC transport system substrate-binding protein